MSATRIIATVLACALAACSPSPRKAAPRPYAERLAELLGPEKMPELVPVLAAAGRDVKTIDPWAGTAAGVALGVHMDDVIAVWGPPDGLMIMRGLSSRFRGREVRLTYGFGLIFMFREDVLTSIHVQNLDDARLAGGPKFHDTRAAALALLGKPIANRRDDTLWTYQRSDVTLELSFLEGGGRSEPLLEVISIARTGEPPHDL